MKSLLVTLAMVFVYSVHGQLLTWTPEFIRESGTSVVEITMDATKGNRGLRNYSTPSDVYVHIGAITTLSTSGTDWKYVRFSSFTTPNPQAQATSLGSDRWRFTINGGLRSFFGITNASERILRIAILFRSGNGSVVQRNADGSDMYVPVYDNGVVVRIDNPPVQPMFTPIPEAITKGVGDRIDITARSADAASMRILFNGVQVASQSGTASLSASPTITAGGMQTIMAEATNGTVTVRDSLRFFIAQPPQVLPLPSGVRDGINLEPGDTSAVLVLHAPQKNYVHVIGEFNDWTQSQPFQMNRTPDGARHWMRVTGLVPGREYAYQYLVDGTLRVADPYTEKVLDPAHDGFIPPASYPSLKAYPLGKTSGIVSILQTRKPAYTWRIPNFTRPDKRNLVIYELLVRDFIRAANWTTMIDTIPYLKRLGVNAIHLMPVNEFEGNSSWGYNPSFYFAPDKFYGPENELRRFIDSCHANGLAVVLDLVLNHAFGQSPFAQLYFDAAAGKPSADNPWLNPDARHPFNVGYDFNHETKATQDLVDRVVEHWLVNYKVDGFRWDLSKGFTQVNNPNNVAAWGNYDQSRINIWRRIYDRMQAVAPGSYCILEHFADNSEEKVLSEYGMMLWGNMNHAFNEATMGYVANSNLSGSLAAQRGWAQHHLIAYQESHDEERLMYKNLLFGNTSNPQHNARNLAVATERNAMATAFWAMMPGPKLLWQFGEMGYDFSITFCPSDNSVPQPYPNMQCRTDPKPPRWDYLNVPERRKLFNVYSALLRLRTNPRFLGTFTSFGNAFTALNGAFKKIKLSGDSLNVLVIGNFDVNPVTDTASFPVTGTWYDHLNGTTLNVTSLTRSFTLQPGQYHVFIDRNLSNDLVTSLADLRPDYGNRSLTVYPNPVSGVATLVYEIPVSGQVDVSVWNLSGQRVAGLFSGRQNRGRHEVKWDVRGATGSRMPPGQYVVSVDVAGRRMQRRFIVQ